jgi:C4-type Zn-finger protein
MLLKGKTLVKCPKTNEEVTVQKECVNCPHFKHVSHESYATLTVACKYGEQDEPNNQ